MKLFIFPLIALMLIGTGCSESSNLPSSNSRDYGYDKQNSISPQSRILSRSDAITGHWDDIREYLNGSETIEACSSESGNCYDLDADISDGSIEQINFPSGGYLNFSAEFDESGSASDVDNDGNNWDFTLDMDSYIVDEAVDDWASSNDYQIE